MKTKNLLPLAAAAGIICAGCAHTRTTTDTVGIDQGAITGNDAYHVKDPPVADTNAFVLQRSDVVSRREADRGHLHLPLEDRMDFDSIPVFCGTKMGRDTFYWWVVPLGKINCGWFVENFYPVTFVDPHPDVWHKGLALQFSLTRR